MAEEKPRCEARVSSGQRKGLVCGRACPEGEKLCHLHSVGGRAMYAALGARGGRGRRKGQPKHPKAPKPAVIDPASLPETTSYQDLIDRAMLRAEECARSDPPQPQQEREWIRLAANTMRDRDNIELQGLKLHFDAPPLTVIFEGLADAPPASFPPPPSGASDDPIAGVTPLPVRQGA